VPCQQRFEGFVTNQSPLAWTQGKDEGIAKREKGESPCLSGASGEGSRGSKHGGGYDDRTLEDPRIISFINYDRE
jgi:hypothetical protein